MRDAITRPERLIVNVKYFVECDEDVCSRMDWRQALIETNQTVKVVQAE